MNELRLFDLDISQDAKDTIERFKTRELTGGGCVSVGGDNQDHGLFLRERPPLPWERKVFLNV